tara:strand:+ start:207 stop:587 length:381 start_codon:yes stop_codon:yes gene_type:complete
MKYIAAACLSLLLCGACTSNDAEETLAKLPNIRCKHERIKGVQVRDSGDVVYVTENDIRRLAAIKDTPEWILESLFTAAEKHYYVQAAFPVGYNCNQSNTSIPLRWIYIQAPEKPKKKKRVAHYDR